MEIALLHSPFLRSSSSQPLAQALRDCGADVRLLSVDDAVQRNDVDYSGLASLIGGRLTRPCALVVHSGAGGLVSSVLEQASEWIRLVIFVDAILPHDGRSWLETAPARLAERVRSLATDGRAPPWSSWFGDEVIARLLPDEADRRHYASDLPRLPLAFLQQPAPPSALFIPSAYLQLSDGYAPEAEQAAGLGWPVQRIVGDHLWWITHPSEVAASLVQIVQLCGVG